MLASGPAEAHARAAGPLGRLQVSGLTLSAKIDTVLLVSSARERLLGQVCEALARRTPVALRVHLAGDTQAAARALEDLCALLAAALEAAGLPGRLLELSIAGDAARPAHAWETRQRLLGPGAVNIVLDAKALASPLLLLELWRLRHENLLRVAISPSVRSACSLLASETAGHLLPATAMQVPGNSAWLMTSLNASNYLATDGSIAAQALSQDAVRVFAEAENRFDTLCWPTAAMRQDAWLNRRIVLRLQGIGDLVAAGGFDPVELTTLRMVADAIRAVRAALLRYSGQLAKHAETLPAIAAGSPRHAVLAGAAQSAWQRRWIDAVRSSALRHRNLLVLSPWSLFPAAAADIRYLDLLPVLALADAHEFRRDFSIASWNFNKFNSFYRRTWAGLRAAESNYVVAERP